MPRYKIIIPPNIKPRPSEIEISAARLICRHFKTPVEFLNPSMGYKQKTPDIVFGGMMWEIKSPQGSSRKNIEKQLRIGLKQSVNIIIDLRRAKIDGVVASKYLLQEANLHRKINRIVIVSKSNSVVDLYKK